MIRRFNYTDRLRIRRKDVRFEVYEENGKWVFDANLSALVDYDLPPESLVFVEAYRQTNWMRFSYGQVGAITPDKNRTLSQFDSPEGILFRVKVTPPNGDLHALLAEADRIPLLEKDKTEGNRKPLLPVKPQKLGNEIFRVDFTGGAPILLINSEIGNYSDIALDPAFASLVYPAAFREILTRVLLIEEHDDDVDANDWKSLWTKFASLSPGLGELPDHQDIDGRLDWIEKAVTGFAARIQSREKFEVFWKATT